MMPQVEGQVAPEPVRREQPAKPNVKIMKKKDYRQAEQYFDGPFNDHILKKQITRTKRENLKSGIDKLKMMSRCLEEDECKGITLTSSKNEFKKGRNWKIRTDAGEGPSYVKKSSGIKLEDEGEDAAVNVLEKNLNLKLHLKTKKVTIMKKKI